MMKLFEMLKQVILTLSSIDYYHKRLRERIMGIDMIRPLSALELGIPAELEPVEYEASDIAILFKIFKNFDISEDDAIIDIGCGKGAVIEALSRYKFGQIAGIEYSYKLFQIALKNIETLKIHNAKVYNQNAEDFPYYNHYTYIYMYNPFGRRVVRNVISKIEDSLEVNNRIICIIYSNPVHHDEIIKHNIFQKSDEYLSKKMNYKIYVYKNSLP